MVVVPQTEHLSQSPGEDPLKRLRGPGEPAHAHKGQDAGVEEEGEAHQHARVAVEHHWMGHLRKEGKKPLFSTSAKKRLL